MKKTRILKDNIEYIDTVKTKVCPIVHFALAIIFLELVIRKVMTGSIFNWHLLNVIIFSLPFACFLTFLTKIFGKKFNKFNLFFLTGLLIVYYEVQFIFFILFSVPFSFSTIELASQGFDFVNVIRDTIVAYFPIFITLFLPLIVLIIFHKRINTERNTKKALVFLGACFVIYLSTFLILQIKGKEDISNKELYFHEEDAIGIIERFGLLTYQKVDIKRQIFGFKATIIADAPEVKPQQTEEEVETIKEYGLNKVDIDFDKLSSSNSDINTLNEYMKNAQPTNRHEYTGMFKGKNLIFILAEGFNEIAVDPERTPTLYKMIHTGFDFTNFYSPVFLSTTGGEFQATTGLIPTQPVLKLWKSEKPTIYYGLGNAFTREGYRAQSYHNWTYTYYKRNITMETLGFKNYKGCGNGMEKLLHTPEEMSKIKYNCKCRWLEYDSDMARVTAPLYMGKDGNFVTYYVTVSGHSPYAAGDNIARHHKETIKDLDYSDPVKYYLASQVELDKMLEELVKQLEASGELDNTVIALVGDHYPYTLKIDQVNEAASYKKDSIVEVNRSNFILWNSAMKEPIVVDKVGSQIDVLPTLLNLFGIEYDSRLIIGKDILSDYEGLAIFSNKSWVSDYGTYFANGSKFVPKPGKKIEGETQAEYIKRMNNRVRNSFNITKLIIDNDYYKYVAEKGK